MKKNAEVLRYMRERRKGTNQGLAAARAGIHVKTVRKYERSGKLPSQLKQPRTWGTRPNPFEEALRVCFSETFEALADGIEERAAQHANQQKNTTETLGEQVQTRNSPKCTFSGMVSIDLKHFLDSDIALVECPDYARTRTLSPRNGVLRFPYHDKRKTRTPNTEQRWTMEKTIWEVVGGERK